MLPSEGSQNCILLVGVGGREKLNCLGWLHSLFWHIPFHFLDQVLFTFPARVTPHYKKSFFFTVHLLCKDMCIHAHLLQQCACQSTCVEVGQLAGVSSLLPSCGYKAWWRAFLPAAPSQQTYFLNAIFKKMFTNLLLLQFVSGTHTFVNHAMLLQTMPGF